MKHYCNGEFSSNGFHHINSVIMKTPFPLSDILGNKKETDLVTIDVCIASEIGYLWNNGIETLNSCCGHGKVDATVIVRNKSIGKMKELGYLQKYPRRVDIRRNKNEFLLKG